MDILARKMIREIEVDFKASYEDFEQFHTARKIHGFGMASTPVGIAFMAGVAGSFPARLQERSDFIAAYKSYKAPATRTEIAYLSSPDFNTPNLMAPIVNAAINEQRPTPRDQTSRLENGNFVADKVDGFKHKVDVKKLSAEVKTKSEEYIKSICHDLTALSVFSLTMTAAGVFAWRTGYKMIDRIHKTHAQPKAETLQGPQ